MADDVIVNKIAHIERCIARIQEEYQGHEAEIVTNQTKQDAIILNLQRASETAIDLGARVVRLENLGVPQTSREVFALLAQKEIIPVQLS